MTTYTEQELYSMPDWKFDVVVHDTAKENSDVRGAIALSYSTSLTSAWTLWKNKIGIRLENIETLAGLPLIMAEFPYKEGLWLRTYHPTNAARALSVLYVLWRQLDS